ncbi:MAG TPA: hypothetical protein VGS19_01180 [Streptosporangiaceae bacterium]|nr:hypothetical protein [Streptosporangiaceae bacterium]
MAPELRAALRRDVAAILQRAATGDFEGMQYIASTTPDLGYVLGCLAGIAEAQLSKHGEAERVPEELAA